MKGAEKNKRLSDNGLGKPSQRLSLENPQQPSLSDDTSSA